MFAVLRKMFLTSLLVLIVLSTGAWQSNPVALAQSAVETPLYSGLTWSSLGASTQEIRVNVNGDTVSLSGEKFEAKEQFPFALPPGVLGFYSNEQLAAAGWESYDSYQGPEGDHYVFYHESGVYLLVEFLQCPDVPGSLCVSVWQSEVVEPALATPSKGAEELDSAAATTFGKKSPANGATAVDPTNATLSWQAYSPTPDKYSWCIQEGSACANNDPDWTSTYNTSVTFNNLAYNKVYYWQVRAVTCIECTPKTFVYADSGTVWKFTTGAATKATIVGNAGVGGAILSYTDGTNKTVTANSTGAYSITVPINWTGTITPSLAGYTFTPKFASFTNLTAGQTIQNFIATPSYVISGNVGLAGVTLSYAVGGTPLTVLSDSLGNYSISVPYGWTGTITPSKAGYGFTPANRSYTNVTANQTFQNYTPALITYTISGNTGTAGVTMSYFYEIPLFVLSDASGNYSITVPQGWSGTVKPVKLGYSFSPASRSYSNLMGNQASQNFSATVCASCADKDTVGVFRPTNGLLYLKNMNVTGYADISINYGQAGDKPVVGDWDGNGTDTIGIYRNGTFYLRNSNTAGIADLVFAFGMPGDQPIAGDWNGDGKDTVGVFRPSTAQFLLRNSNTTGIADAGTFFLGNTGDIAITGDWNGDGKSTTGVFRPSNGVIYLKNANDSGFADITLNYGLPGDKPVVGDWDNNGTTTIGIYRGSTFYLRNSNTNGFADITLALGLPGDLPIAGNWDDKP